MFKLIVSVLRGNWSICAVKMKYVQNLSQRVVCDEYNNPECIKFNNFLMVNLRQNSRRSYRVSRIKSIKILKSF